MAKTRAIVKRRKAVRNIRKITRTMELIATARFKKAMDRATQAAAYTRKLAELVASIRESSGAARHPLLEGREEVRRSIVLVLTSNRGMCGGYNGNMLRMAQPHLKAEAAQHALELEVSGKRGLAFFRAQRMTVDRSYLHFEDKPRFDEVEPLADRYIEEYLSGRLDRLEVVYTRFISASRQAPEIATLLPMGEIDGVGRERTVKEPVAAGPPVDFEFLPSPKDILDEIVPASFKARLFKCFLDSAVSEQIARMVAMKGATENAGTLIKSLTMKYNRARQSQITSELAEIIGTAEALK